MMSVGAGFTLHRVSYGPLAGLAVLVLLGDPCIGLGQAGKKGVEGSQPRMRLIIVLSLLRLATPRGRAVSCVRRSFTPPRPRPDPPGR